MKRAFGGAIILCLLLCGCAAIQEPAFLVEYSLAVPSGSFFEAVTDVPATVSSVPTTPAGADGTETTAAVTIEAEETPEEVPEETLPAGDEDAELLTETDPPEAVTAPTEGKPKLQESRPAAAPVSKLTNVKATEPAKQPEEPAKQPEESAQQSEEPVQQSEEPAQQSEEPLQQHTEPAPAPETHAPTAADAAAFIGRSTSSLFAAIGKPISSSYAPSCLREDGEDGELVYDGFTVYTYRSGNTEIVQDVL